MSAKDYDSTIARMAGNIAAGMVDHHTIEGKDIDAIKVEAVALAFAIIDEVRRVQKEHERDDDSPDTIP